MQRTDRIQTLASRSRFRVGAVVVQPDCLTVVVDGTASALEPRVMEVLVALAEQAGEVVSAEQLLVEVWRGTFYGDNPVHKAIAHLRRVFRTMCDHPSTLRPFESAAIACWLKCSFRVSTAARPCNSALGPAAIPSLD